MHMVHVLHKYESVPAALGEKGSVVVLAIMFDVRIHIVPKVERSLFL